VSAGHKQALILVADDDRDIRELVCFRLEMQGHRTVRAHDGAEALELAERLVPSLCVLDVQMPKLSGFEVLRALRSSEHTAQIPVIFLTASVKDRDIARALEIGADGYLSKPFDSGELQERVEALLGHQATRTPEFA
jgi:DNA-binding response OmpR family regulator